MRRLEEEKDELQLAADQAIALKEQAQREIQVSSYTCLILYGLYVSSDTDMTGLTKMASGITARFTSC
jgi:hypothetical protein